MKVVTTFYRRLTLFERWTDPHSSATPLPSGYRCAVLTPPDLESLRVLRPGLTESEVKRRLSRQDVCVGVWHEGRLVHAAWVTTGPGVGHVNYLEGCLQLSGTDAYVYDTFTARARRGEGIARLRDQYTRVHFAALGYPRTLTLVAPENQAGLRTVASASYAQVCTYRLFRLGAIQSLFRPGSGALGVDVPYLGRCEA